MTAMAVPMGPPGGSLAGRSVKGVLWSGVFGSLGGTIGGWISSLTAGNIKGSAAGKVLGASVGAGAGLLGFGVFQGFKDKKLWNRYQWDRYDYALQTGDLLPNLERGSAWWKRRLKNTVGVAFFGSAIVLAGLGPAMTAVPALAFWGAAVAGSYLLTRLAAPPYKKPDFKGLAKKQAEAAEPEAPEAEELPPPPQNVPVNQRLPRSLADARAAKHLNARRPDGGQIAA